MNKYVISYKCLLNFIIIKRITTYGYNTIHYTKNILLTSNSLKQNANLRSKILKIYFIIGLNAQKKKETEELIFYTK